MRDGRLQPVFLSGKLLQAATIFAQEEKRAPKNLQLSSIYLHEIEIELENFWQ